jgi:hypothetical protein
MNFNPLRKPVAVDLDELESRIHEAHESTSAPSVPYPTREPRERVQHTPLQVIGHAITRLTYKDAVKMGEEIFKKITRDVADGAPTAAELTAAIQAWAADWEKFADILGPREQV